MSHRDNPDEKIVTYYDPLGEMEAVVREYSKRQLFENTINVNFDKMERLLDDNIDDKEAFGKIKAIGHFILQGMSVEEACVLTLMDGAHFREYLENSQAVEYYMNFVQTVYKARLSQVMNDAALAGGDSKITGWMMERKFPREYSAKSVEDLDKDKRSHVLEEGVEFVRKNGDSVPLVAIEAPRDVL